MKIALLLTTLGCSFIMWRCAKDTDSPCDPAWHLSLESNLNKEFEPSDSVLVALSIYLNPDTDNSGDVLYYFDVPTIFENPQGDVGRFISQESKFRYRLKDTLNPPRAVDLYAKTINECNPYYEEVKPFTIVFDTIP
jgi:hypothetical protein